MHSDSVRGVHLGSGADVKRGGRGMRRLRLTCRFPFIRRCVRRRPARTYSDTVFSRIERVMDEQKPYLRPDFSLKELCDLVGANRTYVSAAFRCNKTSFPVFVGERRCRYLASIPESEMEQYDTEELSILSGFPTKRTMFVYLRRFAPDVYLRVRSRVKK